MSSIMITYIPATDSSGSRESVVEGVISCEIVPVKVTDSSSVSC